jgi:RNA polymerase sigma factor for flagellar operon FliA
MTQEVRDLTKEELDELVLGHIALAVSIALGVYNTAPHALELEELKAIAYFGLVDAGSRWNSYCARKSFNPMDKVYFTKYSSLRIRGAIYDRLRSNDWATRSLREKSRKINLASIKADGIDLTNAELAEVTGLTEKEIRDTLTGMSRAPVSLDSVVAPWADDSGNTISNGSSQLADAEDTESAAAVNSLLESFADAVKDLPFEQRLLIVLHYHQGLELKKAAALMGITDTVASTYHTSAVIKLLEILQEAAL